MKKDLDKIIREKLEDLELHPNPESKHIFLKSLPQKKAKNLLWKISTSAAVILLLILLKNDNQLTIDSDVILHSDPSEWNHIASEESEQMDTKISEKAEAPVVDLKRSIRTDRPKSDQCIGERDSVAQNRYLTLNADLNNTEVSSIFFENKDDHPSAPEIEIRISGITEQMLYAAQQEMYSQKKEISMQFAYYKLTFPAPIIDDVEQTFNQVRNGISQFNIADVGKSLTNSINNRLNTKKNPSQKSN